MIPYLLLSCATVVTAHMEMTFPLPIQSKFDKANNNPDYSMTAPLNGDGSNFPWYLARPDKHVTASFSAGQAASFALAGTAVHGGGSCQVSLSYDGGKTFKVVNSILGGCPLQSAYNFTMPAGLPAGNNVVFSWSWFNKVGNRELYQNCALVNIAGTGSNAFLSTLPDMQVANVGNGCTSIESIEVIPTNPGSSVQYGGSYVAGASAVNGKFGAGLTGTCGTTSNNAVGAGNVNTVPVSPTTTVAVAAPASSSAFASIPAAVPATNTGSCSGTGGIICTGTGYTWAQCVNGAPVNMGAVAPGTICMNGAMTFDTTGGKGVVAQQPVNNPVISTTKTSSVIPASTPSSGCINRRGISDCEDFEVRCDPDHRSYSLCSGGVWSSFIDIEGELCTIPNQRVFSTSQICSGTGISCSADGSRFYICNEESEYEVPSGTKCLEGALGGGIVAW